MMNAKAIPVWEPRCDQLDLRIGAYVLLAVPLNALSLQSNPFVVSPDLAAPLDQAVAEGYQAVVKYGTLIAQDFRTIRIGRSELRYVARYGERYVVDISGSFDDYLLKFSGKSRTTLKRKAKRVSKTNERSSLIQEFNTPCEITAFRDIAISISHQSYKKELGWGFREDQEFERRLEQDAAAGKVRGYVLSIGDQPAAYVFCRIDHDVIIYSHLGYDQQFEKESPGTVLLYLLLERLFDQREFRLLDFDGMEYVPYKQFFATRMLRCARVVWMRPTLKNCTIVAGHWLITTAWRLMTARRDAARRSRWDSVRSLPSRWRHVRARTGRQSAANP